MGGREEGELKRRGKIRYGRRCTVGQKIEQRYVAAEDGELGVATRKSRCQGSRSLPGPHWDDIS